MGWFSKKSKFEDVHKHEHIWSNWSIESDKTSVVTNSFGGNITSNHRVIIQKRHCMGCKFEERNIEKFVTDSVIFSDIGKKS